MGQLLLLLIAEIIGLYILSKNLTRKLYLSILMILRHRSLAIPAITIILFPGTVIHELSHLFTAEILGVRTGKLQLAPESIEGDEIRVGSVEFQKTDPFRRSAIGLAPFFVGLIALFICSSLLPTFWDSTVLAYKQGILFSSPSLYVVLLTSYFLFCVSNTMFTSKEDMKGVIPLFIVLTLLGSAFYLAGMRIGITGAFAVSVTGILIGITRSLSGVLILNLFLFILSSLFLKLLKKA